MKHFNNLAARMIYHKAVISVLIILRQPLICLSQFSDPGHRDPRPGEIAVTAPGNYGEAGRSYILMNDISCTTSPVFLGKDVTFDLNGFTISYADGNYGHITNYSFEDGLKGWDVSMAPSASIEDTRVQVMIGDKVLKLKSGEEIVSEYVDLPVALRSYFAMCGVADPGMKVSIYVEDSRGETVNCVIRYGEEVVISSPAESLSPRLGGGIVYSHFHGLPSGRYRVRIRALTDCILDYIDIRPALDTGIGIIEDIRPQVNYKHLYESIHGAFFDFGTGETGGVPVEGIPVVKGTGTISIKNGTIINRARGILSWGIQSTADSVIIILDNLKIVTSGINTNAADVAQAVITRCTFDVDNPFIINRHGSDNYGVDLWGKFSSEVSFSEFYGGQGCLVFKGDHSKVHHNFFANRQSVTNHYSIMAMGDSSQIFSNVIIPETGSGIEIYVHRGMEIFNNEIKIKASPPTCEYGHSDYSTTAIRIADYNAQPGSGRGAFGNRVYSNRISVTGMDYPYYPDYVPMAWAVFYSASGGENYIYGNEITVEDQTPGLKNETSAFYIGGGSVGGTFSGNRITANVPAFWVASRYGDAKNIKIINNLIVKSPEAGSDYKPVRMGWNRNMAENIEFSSNETLGSGFEIDKTDNNHSYSVSWKLTVRTEDKHGRAIKGAEVVILDTNGNEVFHKGTGSDGLLLTELPEYSMAGSVAAYQSPYTVISNVERRVVKLERNTDLTLKVK